MRTVSHESEFSAALAGAKRESKASFADDTMIIEKLVVRPRHVELQIMADNHGNVVHLFERDCSIQRRHQKIIEEAPAPHLSDSLRQQLAKAACNVARSIQYTGAGTVEFLVDEKHQFYFMEMNTRLQVEHPVTEMITGLDLVAWQLKIAANEKLPLSQDCIQVHGHAIECRIYAEDSHHNFIPSIGEIQFLQEPSEAGIRIDTGIQLGSQITMHYDPMIAKLITWGTTRDEALLRLEHALSHYFIGGVKTNIPFLQAICRHPQFRRAELSTDFLTKEEIILTRPDQEIALLMTVSFDYLQRINTILDPLLQETFAWQSLATSCWTWRYKDKDELIETIISPINMNQFKIQLRKKDYFINASQIHNQLYVEINKQNYEATVENKSCSLTLYTHQGQITIERFNWSTLNVQTSPKGQLTAPMPATVVAILKNIGDEVKAGERLIVLEAMKMEHTIHAPTDGILSDIFYNVGAQVNEGEELLSLKE